jgi:prevent-host-death family protein
MATLPKSLPVAGTLSKVKLTSSRRAAVGSAASRETAKSETIAAAKAKTHFLQLLDQVERDRQPITITKRGRVVAQIVPAPAEVGVSVFDQVFGRMKGTGTIVGDIVSPDHESWGPKWR